jgi:acetyltransferase
MAYIYEQIKAFLNPASIALIGASEETESIPGRATRYIFGMGLDGPVVPVNPSRERVLGSRTYPDIEAIPFPIELALILRPSDEVYGILESCGRKGVPFAIIAAGGFAETGGEGAIRQKELYRLARKLGMRVLGPNCMGYINLHGRVCTSFSPIMELPLTKGSVGIVSQSGAIAGSIMNRLQDAGVGTSILVSTGNEMDLTINDFLNYLIDEDSTRVIVIYLEGIRDGKEFLYAAERAFQSGKPIVVMSGGTSLTGKSIAASHTGSIAASGDILKGALRQRGSLLCSDMEELVGTVSILSQHPALSGDGIGVLATSGGASAIFADKVEQMGLTLARFAAETSRRLSLILKFGTAQNPLDLTGQVVTGESSFFAEAVRLVLEDENVHLLVLLITQIRGPSGRALFGAVAEETRKIGKPVIAVSASGSLAEDCLSLLRESGRITIFRSFSECARAIQRILKYETYRRERGKRTCRV